jgi:hypothetical protein
VDTLIEGIDRRVRHNGPLPMQHACDLQQGSSLFFVTGTVSLRSARCVHSSIDKLSNLIEFPMSQLERKAYQAHQYY